MNPDVRAAALAWAAAGACVLPTRQDGSKAPDRPWKGYVHTPGAKVPAAPAVAIVDTWFAAEGACGLGLILGAVSGNLEMLELEGRAVDEGLLGAFSELMLANGLGSLWTRLRGGYVERTPKGGLHFLYRLSDGCALGNTRLAARPSNQVELAAEPGAKVQVLIETRGEGGHVVVAPSNGRTHPNGKSWVLTVGQPGVVASITVAERDAMFAVARMLDQVPVVPRPARKAYEESQRSGNPFAKGFGGSGLSPLDDFEARVDWADILEPAGWTYVTTEDSVTYWLRPGKHRGADGWGWSASTGYWDERDCIYVWSSSTDLPVGEWLTKGRVYAALNHGGDLTEATLDLIEQGFGEQRAPVSSAAALVAPPADVVPESVEDTRSSWAPVALGPVALRERDRSPRSTALRLGMEADGIALFYPGRVNGIIGESETGKTWVALLAVAQELLAGNHVGYLDFEDSAEGIVDRLLDLGVPAETVISRLSYINPDATPAADDWEPLFAALTGSTVIIVDGYNAAMDLFGLSLMDNGDCTRFVNVFLKPLCRTGGAVIYVDHITKAQPGNTQRAAGGIGAQAKRAATTGCCLLATAVEGAQLAPGRLGHLVLDVDKDRLGDVRRFAREGKRVGTFNLDSTGEKLVAWISAPRVVVEPSPQDKFQIEVAIRIRIAKEIFDLLAGGGELSGNQIENAVTGKAITVREVLNRLASDQLLARGAGARNAVVYAIHPGVAQVPDGWGTYPEAVESDDE